jgi:SWI/SNF-related matrix-associated actin-dependent regulator 1 of chromatin subfamily A
MSYELNKFDAGYSLAISPQYLADPEIVSMVRKLPARVERRANGWILGYPDTVFQRAQLDKKVANLGKKIDKRIRQVVETATQQVGEVRPLPDLEVRLPVRRPLYDFQTYGVAYCIKHRRVIIGDHPGTGKTTQAAAVLLAGRVMGETSTVPALIICPATIKRKWQKELMEVAGLRGAILNDRIKTKWPYLLQSGQIDALIVNYESLTKYFVRAELNGQEEDLKVKHIQFNQNLHLFKTVIVDEVNRCKNWDTRTSKLVYGITQGFGYEWILALTGTILVNRPSDIMAQLAIVGRIKEFGGWNYFKLRYCQGGKGAANLEELYYRLTETCYYRRLKRDVLKDLPDKTRTVVLVDIDNRAEYDHAETRFEDYLRKIKNCPDEEVDRKLRGKFMVELGILREISARGKIKAVKEWADNLLESGEKVVIFCNLLDIIDRLKRIFPGALEISGRVSSDDRDRYVTLFQTSPGHRVILCNHQAGGEGIDLFASSNVGFIEEPWTYAKYEQCEDRLHRNGQKNAVNSNSFLGADTLDDFVHDKILEKKNLADIVTGTKDESREVVDTLLNLIAKHKKPSEIW